MIEPKVNCILVIDDDKAHRYLSEKAIKEADIADTYQLVPNGEEGIKFIRKYRSKHGVCPSMIFLDTLMPVMDATEFIEEYNRLDIQRRGKEGAIILMSAYPENDTLLKEKLGVKALIAKPLTKERILQNYHQYYKLIMKGTFLDNHSRN